MAWDRKVPNDDTKVRAADDAFRANFTALDDAIGREHIFAGDSGSAEGRHRPGRTGVIFVGTTAQCSSLASKEGCGALSYDTTLNCFQSWNGTEWRKYDHIKTAGDTLTVNWYVPGAYIDGRDPSVDGAKLDNIPEYGDNVEVIEIYDTENGAIIPPITGFSKEDSYVWIHNMSAFNLEASATFRVKQLYCWTHVPAVGPASAGWQVVSQLGFGPDNSTSIYYEAPLVYGLLIGVKREK